MGGFWKVVDDKYIESLDRFKIYDSQLSLLDKFVEYFDKGDFESALKFLDVLISIEPRRKIRKSLLRFCKDKYRYLIGRDLFAVAQELYSKIEILFPRDKGLRRIIEKITVLQETQTGVFQALPFEDKVRRIAHQFIQDNHPNELSLFDFIWDVFKSVDISILTDRSPAEALAAVGREKKFEEAASLKIVLCLVSAYRRMAQEETPPSRDSLVSHLTNLSVELNLSQFTLNRLVRSLSNLSEKDLF